MSVSKGGCKDVEAGTSAAGILRDGVTVRNGWSHFWLWGDRKCC